MKAVKAMKSVKAIYTRTSSKTNEKKVASSMSQIVSGTSTCKYEHAGSDARAKMGPAGGRASIA